MKYALFILSLVLAAHSADAAIALQGTFYTEFNDPEVTEVASITFSATVNAGTDTVLIVAVGFENTGTGAESITGVTFNGDALTQHAQIDTATWSGTAVFYRVAPDVATANVVVSLNDDKVHAAAFAADGVDQATPLVTAVTTTGTGTGTGNQTVATAGTDDLLFDSISIDSNNHSPVGGADQTERWEYESTEGGYHTHAGSTQLFSAGQVMSYTWTGSSPFSYIATALNAAAGGVPPPAPTPQQSEFFFD